MEWTQKGLADDVWQAHHPNGYLTVVRFGGIWAATLNGRVLGTARTAGEAKSIAENGGRKPSSRECDRTDRARQLHP